MRRSCGASQWQWATANEPHAIKGWAIAHLPIGGAPIVGLFALWAGQKRDISPKPKNQSAGLIGFHARMPLVGDIGGRSVGGPRARVCSGINARVLALSGGRIMRRLLSIVAAVLVLAAMATPARAAFHLFGGLSFPSRFRVLLPGEVFVPTVQIVEKSIIPPPPFLRLPLRFIQPAN